MNDININIYYIYWIDVVNAYKPIPLAEHSYHLKKDKTENVIHLHTTSELNEYYLLTYLLTIEE